MMVPPDATLFDSLVPWWVFNLNQDCRLSSNIYNRSDEETNFLLVSSFLGIMDHYFSKTHGEEAEI